MFFDPQHELHRRRFGRNLGLGLVLVAFVAIVFGLTLVKVTNGAGAQIAGSVQIQQGQTAGQTTGQTAAQGAGHQP